MTIRLSRRTFLGGSATAALAGVAGPGIAAPGEGGTDRLLLLVHDGSRPWEDAAPTLARTDPETPLLIVGERRLPGIGDPASTAVVSWSAFDLLRPERLAARLQAGMPVRVASAADRLPEPRRAAWAGLGRLLALRPEFRCVVADLAGGGRQASFDAMAEGLDAFRAGLGPDAASRLVIRFTRDPNRTG